MKHSAVRACLLLTLITLAACAQAGIARLDPMPVASPHSSPLPTPVPSPLVSPSPLPTVAFVPRYVANIDASPILGTNTAAVTITIHANAAIPDLGVLASFVGPAQPPTFLGPSAWRPGDVEAGRTLQLATILAFPNDQIHDMIVSLTSAGKNYMGGASIRIDTRTGMIVVRPTMVVPPNVRVNTTATFVPRPSATATPIEPEATPTVVP